MKSTLRQIFALCAGIVLSGAARGAPPEAAPAPAGPALRIYNWSTYIDLDDTVPTNRPVAERSPTLRKFAAQFHCRVEYYEYDSSDEMLAKLMNMPGFFDVVVASSEDAMALQAAGKLAPVPESAVPNLRHIDPRYRRSPRDPEGRYFAPYLTGITGLAYRRDLAGRAVSGWKDYFEPDPAWKGRLGAMDSCPEMMYAALKYTGVGVNATNRAELVKAAGALQRLKNEGYFRLFTMDMDELGAALSEGRIVMAPMFSTDALAAVEADPARRIAFVIPKEGAEYYLDSWVVPASAPHRELAYQFVNFALSPEIHAAIAVYLRARCPNTAALRLLAAQAPELLRNPAVYPPPEVERTLDTPYATSDELHSLWLKIRPPGGSPESGKP